MLIHNFARLRMQMQLEMVRVMVVYKPIRTLATGTKMARYKSADPHLSSSPLFPICPCGRPLVCQCLTMSQSQYILQIQCCTILNSWICGIPQNSARIPPNIHLIHTKGPWSTSCGIEMHAKASLYPYPDNCLHMFWKVSQNPSSRSLLHKQCTTTS